MDGDGDLLSHGDCACLRDGKDTSPRAGIGAGRASPIGVANHSLVASAVFRGFGFEEVDTFLAQSKSDPGAFLAKRQVGGRGKKIGRTNGRDHFELRSRAPARDGVRLRGVARAEKPAQNAFLKAGQAGPQRRMRPTKAYSARNASIGRTRVARTAGTYTEKSEIRVTRAKTAT